MRAIRTSDVAAFLRCQFRHANTVLSVVGGASLAGVRASVRRHFCHGRAGPPCRVPPVRLGRGGMLRMRDREGSQAFLSVLTPVPAEPRALLATGVALDLVGADPDSRLFQELRERLGLSYEVGAHLEWGADWALAVIHASGARSQADRLVRAVADTCRRAAEEGFGDEELQRARKKLRYRYAALADSRIDLALALAESLLWGFPCPEETERMVADLTGREIEAAWRRVIAARNVTAVLGA